LKKKGILESKTKGNIKLYTLKNSSKTKDFLILTEQYKKIMFLNNFPLIREVLEKLDNELTGLIIIFGSYAKNIPKNDSDLDLFIIGKFDETKIKKIGKKYGIEINIKSYPLKIFKNELNTDILLKEIVENHILIRNIYQFVNEVKKWN